MAISRKRFWGVAGLLVVAVLVVALIWIAVLSQRSKDREMVRASLSRTVAMGDIMEAVFRYQLSKGEALQHVEVVFLGLFGADGYTDVSERFMKRFAGHTPPVKPVSVCGFDEEDDNQVIDNETGKPSVILFFWPDETRWKSERKVEVVSEYWFAGASSKGYVYTVIRRDEKWVVVDAKLFMVS